MTRETFMNGQAYKMPASGKQDCGDGHHQWHLAHCEIDDWDGYECRVCGAKFTERCTFDEDCK